MNKLNELISEIEEERSNRGLSNEYLKSINETTWEGAARVGEFDYGITYVRTDLVLPYLKKLQEERNNVTP